MKKIGICFAMLAILFSAGLAFVSCDNGGGGGSSGGGGGGGTGGLSGTYVYEDTSFMEMSINFSGSTATLNFENTWLATMSFSVSSGKVTLLPPVNMNTNHPLYAFVVIGGGFDEDEITSESFTIVDDNTLKDSNDEFWRK